MSGPGRAARVARGRKSRGGEPRDPASPVVTRRHGPSSARDSDAQLFVLIIPRAHAQLVVTSCRRPAIGMNIHRLLNCSGGVCPMPISRPVPFAGRGRHVSAVHRGGPGSNPAGAPGPSVFGVWSDPDFRLATRGSPGVAQTDTLALLPLVKRKHFFDHFDFRLASRGSPGVAQLLFWRPATRAAPTCVSRAATPPTLPQTKQ